MAQDRTPLAEKPGISRPPVASGAPVPFVPAWARLLVRLMDDALPIPGTKYRFGWDAVAGALAPGAGDALSAASHIALLLAAFRADVPKIVFVRMVGNAAVDALTGMVPVLGDLFDIAFKANRKNLELLERAIGASPRGEPRKKLSDYLVVGAAIAVVLSIMTLPLLLAALLWHALFTR